VRLLYLVELASEVVDDDDEFSRLGELSSVSSANRVGAVPNDLSRKAECLLAGFVKIGKALSRLVGDLP